MRAAHATDGYSLVEMLAMLALISLVGGILFVGKPWAKRPETLDAISRNIEHLARGVSLAAVSRGEMAAIKVDIARRKVFGDRTAQEIVIPAAYKLSVLTGSELVQQGSLGKIEFYSDGTSSGGEIKLEDAAGNSRALRINWLTGAIMVAIGSKP